MLINTQNSKRAIKKICFIDAHLTRFKIDLDCQVLETHVGLSQNIKITGKKCSFMQVGISLGEKCIRGFSTNCVKKFEV